MWLNVVLRAASCWVKNRIGGKRFPFLGGGNDCCDDDGGIRTQKLEIEG